MLGKETEECSDIIDVLSLIPPEWLQDEIEEDESNEQDGLLNHDEVDMEIDEIHANVSVDNDSISPANVTQAIIPSASGTQQNITTCTNSNTGVTDTHVNVTQSLAEERNILQAIVQELLAKHNCDRWKRRGLTAATLFKHFLSNAQTINNFFTVEEKDKIAKVYCRYTSAPPPFKKSDKKAVKRNVLSSWRQKLHSGKTTCKERCHTFAIIGKATHLEAFIS